MAETIGLFDSSTVKDDFRFDEKCKGLALPFLQDNYSTDSSLHIILEVPDVHSI
jgi:hypothetical protein